MNKEDAENYCEDGIERLCAAVVNQAAKDYQSALRVLQRRPNDIQARRMTADCESFFRNEIELYSDLDGESIIRKIRQMVNEGRGMNGEKEI